MLTNGLTCKTDMNGDNYSTFGDCPKAKKSKTEQLPLDHWANLPSVVIHEIFDLLNKRDRQNASSVCKNWRTNLFHPKWWPKVTFKIEPRNISRAKFFTTVFGRSISGATVKVNTLVHECTAEFLTLLEAFSENNNLKQLIIEPTHCHFNIFLTNYRNYSSNIETVIATLKRCLPNLSKFSIGGIEAFAPYLHEYLMILAQEQPEKVTTLGLASVKDNPNEYEDSYFECDLIKPFTNLKVLSVDYDQLSDTFLRCLEGSTNLQRLVVLLHGVREGHPGTSNAAWNEFVQQHPNCELRLTLIHCYEEIKLLHQNVLKPEMPLTHLKVFFCENINMALFEFMSRCYIETLRSIMWVDSFSESKRSWSFLTPHYENSPDPLIMISWLCKQIDELVLYGYKYRDENLIAIARLRGDKLKRLEIAEEDIICSNYHGSSGDNFLMDIPLHLKQQWSPTKTADLHPVIRNPTAGDSDEYLLPLVLADLH